MMIRPYIKLSKAINTSAIVRAATFVILYARQHMMQPGKVESFLIIFDTNHAMPWSLPVSAVKEFGGVLSFYFRCMGRKTFALNTNSAITWTYNKIAHSFMQEIQRRKVTLVNEHTCDELESMVEKDMRLKKHGGTHEEPDCWWPPVVPGKQHIPDEVGANFDLNSHRELKLQTQPSIVRN